MIPGEWIEHRRPGDRELVGFLEMVGDGFVAHDLVGRAVTDVVDYETAETALEDAGLRQLGEPWLLRHDDGSRQRVAIVEIDRTRVVVANADFALVVGTPVDIGQRVELALPTDRLEPA